MARKRKIKVKVKVPDDVYYEALRQGMQVVYSKQWAAIVAAIEVLATGNMEECAKIADKLAREFRRRAKEK